VQNIDGARGVRIRDGVFGVELLWMRNGRQWQGSEVDVTLLRMIRDACDDALRQLPNVAAKRQATDCEAGRGLSA